MSNAKDTAHRLRATTSASINQSITSFYILQQVYHAVLFSVSSGVMAKKSWDNCRPPKFRTAEKMSDNFLPAGNFSLKNAKSEAKNTHLQNFKV